MELQDDNPEGDWTAPGVHRCAPGVHRIPLPLPNDGLRAVNVYAVADGTGFTLIDAGWALQQSGDLLGRALAALGAGFGDVRQFLVTHAHRDHYTQAVTLRKEFGTPVALGRGEQPALRAITDPDRKPMGQRPRLVRAGADELLRALDSQPKEQADPSEWESPDRWIDDGAVFTVGERGLEAVSTPGHTRGHVVFADETAGLLFSGDHVLPRITPSIGFEAVPPPSPLADFLNSLELLLTRPDAALLPAHGPVGMRVHERVDELLAHHGKRLDATLAALYEGRTTAAQVAAALPWTRRERTLADLDPFNAMLAVLETAAHLDVLVERRIATRSEQDGVAHYTT
ncbi:MBL fold metallo-hydrolase [Pseudonocardia sp. TRM90224]|uniref:MBL fold metallo-hydrolase n=1 Tax=Pseudonocardia sp. TRM90224 TaxID=2812678 RepID=UPI001E419DFA|nr:MBL fold metallo-hydrolase [Pseudonocardia sp. TRM90224]